MSESWIDILGSEVAICWVASCGGVWGFVLEG